MSAFKSLAAIHSWSGVARWTVFGTLACTLVSVAFNFMVFGDLGDAALRRSLLSATVLPILLGVPLFLHMGLRIRSLALSNKRLNMMAHTDSLTACLARGAFTSRVGSLLAHLAPGTPGAILVIDADNFKAINDQFGHNSGDEALAIIARSIRAVLRAGDLVGRIGGEEFAVYLPRMDQHHAGIVAERIRRSVNLAAFAPHGRTRALSVSIGGAAFEGPVDFATLFHVADQRLYKAKQAGRNRVRVDDEPADLPPPQLARSA